MRFFIGCTLVLLLCAASTRAQLVVGNDQSTAANPTIWLIDITGGSPNRALVSGGTNAQVWGLAVDDPGQTIYWNNGGTLIKAAYAPGPGMLTPSVIGTLTFNAATTNVTGMAFSGSKLYGYRSVTLPGFYEIDPGTAMMTLVNATPASTDFGGFDFDSVTNAFYACNDGTGLSGRGLYRIDNFFGAPTYTFLAAYPGGDTDVDGLAVGNGRAYMVNDNSTANQGIYVFNLTTLTYEASLTNPFSATSGIFAGGGWAPGLIPEPSSLALVGIGLLACLRRR